MNHLRQAELTPDEMEEMSPEAFRLMYRNWLEASYPSEIRFPAKRLHFRDTKVWYEILARKGWLAPGWPREYGGLGLSAGKQLIIIEEQERYGCARTNDMGMVFLGPLLIRHGTPEQKAFFLPKILSGEHIWCQGYSEPNSGSDLASLQTEAVSNGDEWVINGQKIWTTLANDANWIFLLVRTNKSAKKQEGISFLLVRMDSPGITVRPIVSLDLNDEFCQVFFTDVHVPYKNIVGQVNQGWTMAKAQLGFERIFLGSPKQSAYAMSHLQEIGRRLDLIENSDFRDVYTQLQLDVDDHTALYEFYADKLRAGELLGPETSLLKLHQSELFQRISEAMLGFAGEYSGLLHRHPDLGHANPAGLFIQSRLVTIAAGSSEIQRNIVARQVLDLPT